MNQVELKNIKTGEYQFTLGNFIDCDNEWVVYDGSDYIGFSKSEYEIVNKNIIK